MIAPSPSRIISANQLPLNRTAREFLPEDWRADGTEIFTLSLMRWGLENGVDVTPPAPGMPDQQQVEDRITTLSLRDPERATEYLEGDEELASDWRVLEKQKTPVEAAAYLLENLYDLIGEEMSQPG